MISDKITITLTKNESLEAAKCVLAVHSVNPKSSHLNLESLYRDLIIQTSRQCSPADAEEYAALIKGSDQTPSDEFPEFIGGTN